MASGHCVRYTLDFNFFKALEDTLPRPKADDDFGHTEKEGLNPELHQFALEIVAVAVVANLSRGFELDPVDWGTRTRF